MPEIQNERLATLESDVKHIISLLEDYCTLKDDVTTAKNDITWIKRIGYSLGGVTTLSIIGAVVKRSFFP
jgi:hypothetical protein